MNTIRKISVGSNYPDGALHYQIGKSQKLNGEIYEITSINKNITESKINYDVIIKSSNGSNVVWKTITDLPVVIEYLVDFE